MSTRAKPIVTCILLLCASSVAADAVQTLVRRLVSASHGMTPESGAWVPTALDTVRRDPAAYVPVLAAYVSARASRSDGAAREAGIAAWVLANACGDRGCAELASRVAPLARSSDSLELVIVTRAPREDRKSARWAELRRQQSRIGSLESVCVDAMAEAGDARLVEYVMRRMPLANGSLVQTYLRYLNATAPTDTSVTRRLREMYETSENLRGRPVLRNVIDMRMRNTK